MVGVVCEVSLRTAAYLAGMSNVPFILSVDIREIREVRIGTDSKDFDKQKPELMKIDQFDQICFVVYYGSDFKLKSLSVAGMYIEFPSIM